MVFVGDMLSRIYDVNFTSLRTILSSMNAEFILNFPDDLSKLIMQYNSIHDYDQSKTGILEIDKFKEILPQVMPTQGKRLIFEYFYPMTDTYITIDYQICGPDSVKFCNSLASIFELFKKCQETFKTQTILDFNNFLDKIPRTVPKFIVYCLNRTTLDSKEANENSFELLRHSYNKKGTSFVVTPSNIDQLVYLPPLNPLSIPIMEFNRFT